MSNFVTLAISRFINQLSSNAGSTLVGYLASGSGAVARTVRDVLRDYASVKNYGAKGDGITGDSASIQACINANGHTWIPDGTFLIDADLIVPDNKIIAFSKGAKFLASANNRIFFKSTTHAYFSQIWNATLDGNGKTGVVGFDMANFRLQAGIFNAHIQNANNGFIMRSGCFGTQLLNPNTINVPYPLQAIENCGVLDIIHPTFDNESADGGTALGIGIDVQGAGIANEGVRISGGFVQGFVRGLQDAGLGTRVYGTYFEQCTEADIYGNGARQGQYEGCQHFAAVGAAAYKLRNCDAITIFNPNAGSGARTALYDIDATNTNCVEYRTNSNASFNAPTGSITNLSSIVKQTNFSFTPVVAGSTAAGVGTYTTQIAKIVQRGSCVHVQIDVAWTAHTGTGALLITGIPTVLTPSSFTPRPIGQTAVTNMATTGQQMFAVFSGTGTQISIRQVSTAGVESLTPIATAGYISINLTYEM